jgi:hypothetical protein
MFVDASVNITFSGGAVPDTGVPVKGTLPE